MAEKVGKQRVDFNELKSGGFIKQTQKDLFTVRLKVPGGRITAEKLVKIAE
ncbi:MAG TPA: sulfite reductase, partial [Candidatus Brocadiaceae bacterium]|nr:sulfite reductase [Candidatus Brocadiaceae bacterium]